MNIEGNGGIGVGSSMGLEARFGPVMGSVGLPVNEGPVGMEVFKNTMPLNIGFKPVEAIKFNVPVKPETVHDPISPETVASVENFLVQLRVQPQVKPMVEPAVAPDIWEYLMLKTAVSRVLKPAVKAENYFNVSAGNQVKSKVEDIPTLLTQPLAQEQEIGTEEITEEKMPKKQKSLVEEEEMMERQLFLEDEEVSAVRKGEIRQAVVQARLEAVKLSLKKITGWLVAKFLPPEHMGNRSQIVKKTGPDGSYQETVEAITGAGEFESDQQAIERSDQIVAEKKPVKLGKKGTPVKGIDVVRVFKYKIIKPIQASTEVIKRVTKKRVVQPGVVNNAIYSQGWLADKQEPKKETDINDLGLTEVFPKAA